MPSPLRPRNPWPRRAVRGLVLAALAGLGPGHAGAQGVPLSGRLTVFNAGSLGAPFRDLLRAFAAAHPGLEVAQESAGSLESARKLTELGRVPDVIGVADYAVIPTLLVPRYATWYAGFARNAMVLVYTDRSVGAREVGPDTWWRVLLRPRVRTGRSDPALDPNGYRTLMVYQLAERHYGQPGLAARLLAASPPKYVRPKEADLVALVQAGELDYAWSYRSIATTVGLPFVPLPAAIDLSDPGLDAAYAAARVRVPGPTARADSVEFRGEPILYGLTIPLGAANPAAGVAFVQFIFSEAGQAILRRHGFGLLARPTLSGPGEPPAALRDWFRASTSPNPRVER